METEDVWMPLFPASNVIVRMIKGLDRGNEQGA